MEKKRKPRTSNIGKQKQGSVTSRPLIQVRDFQQKFESLFKAEKDSIELVPIDQSLKQTVDIGTLDCIMPSPSMIIEEAITNQLNELFPERQSSKKRKTEGERQTKIDFTKIPLYSDLQSKIQGTLISLSEEGKKENALMLPRKEVNYITPKMQSTEKTLIFKPISSNEVILHVSFYHPERNLKIHEFQVLASQKLSELKDAFYCLSDIGSKIKSGYFFIENTFFNDMRATDSKDCSEEIIQWAEENEVYRQTGAYPLYSKKMEETTFYDISLRVGEKYLYCHQGNCKHYIIFNEVRLINDQDNLNYNSYPLKIFQSKVRRKKCTVCEIYSAKWVVYKDKQSPENPTFYCENCHKQFHYSQDGKPLYEGYEVYDYYHE